MTDKNASLLEDVKEKNNEIKALEKEVKIIIYFAMNKRVHVKKC